MQFGSVLGRALGRPAGGGRFRGGLPSRQLPASDTVEHLDELAVGLLGAQRRRAVVVRLVLLTGGDSFADGMGFRFRLQFAEDKKHVVPGDGYERAREAIRLRDDGTA